MRLLDVPTIKALTSAAREQGVKSVAHAAQYQAVLNAVDGEVDILTHVPLDRPIDEELAARIVAAGISCVPTLVMMRATAAMLAQMRPGAVSFENAFASVATLRAAGAVIGAGTDAHPGAGAPNAVAFGTSLQDELELLVEVGMSPAEALAAATSVNAEIFGLVEHGRAAAAQRADLVLVGGDPTEGIRAVRDVRRVWLAGEPLADLH